MGDGSFETGRGPGRLVLIVGPSGAGKDTLVGLARRALVNHKDIIFSERLVTRSSSVGGEEIEISNDEFLAGLARGDYSFSWRAHGHAYAVSKNLDDQLAKGRVVVVNASRSVIDEARMRYPRVAVIYIDASRKVLAKRLAGRGRETQDEILERLMRAGDNTSQRALADLVIENDGCPEAGAACLIRFVASC